MAQFTVTTITTVASEEENSNNQIHVELFAKFKMPIFYVKFFLLLFSFVSVAERNSLSFKAFYSL